MSLAAVRATEGRCPACDKEAEQIDPVLWKCKTDGEYSFVDGQIEFLPAPAPVKKAAPKKSA